MKRSIKEQVEQKDVNAEFHPAIERKKISG
jgi:hypothetical protein